VREDQHADVIRNHTCRTISAFMAEVREYLRRRNRIRIRVDIESRRAG
jgi:hypothetical protein